MYDNRLNHRYLYITATFFMLLSCNSAMEFNSGRDEEKSSESERDGSENQNADDPVMVGGAYLACAEVRDDGSTGLSAANSTGPKTIGCAINDVNTGAQYNLSGVNANWQISEKGSPVEVNTVDGTATDPYHKKFVFADQSYSSQSLSVELRAPNGTSRSFNRNFLPLDKTLRAMGLSQDKPPASAKGLPVVAMFSSARKTNLGTISLPLCVGGKFKPDNAGFFYEIPIVYRELNTNFDLQQNAQINCYDSRREIFSSLVTDGCMIVPVRTTSGTVDYIFKTPNLSISQFKATYKCR